MGGFSFSDDVGDGTKTTFPFTFVGPDNGYFDLTDILVLVNGVSVSFEVTGPTQVTLTSAPASGAKVRIRRKEDTDVPYTSFQRGNRFGQDNINRSFQQQLYLAHELLDGFKPDGYYEKQDLSLGGNKLKDLAPGVLPTDAITVGQLGTSTQDAAASAAAALVSQNAAAASATTANDKATIAIAAANAAEQHKLKAEDWAEELENVEVETGMFSAKHHSIKAGASAQAANVFSGVASNAADDASASEANALIYMNNAVASASDAENYKDLAFTYQGNASTSASSASTSATNAGLSEDKAQKWATEIVNVPVEPGLFSAYHYASKAFDAANLADGYQLIAEGYADDALVSKNAAGISATAANTSASNALASADAADISEANTLSYRNAAEGFATSASDSEAAALSYKDLALGYSNSASTSATTATDKATIATAAANAAEQHKLKAQEWASNPENVQVETGLYSALHHSAKAGASAQAALTFSGVASNSADDALLYRNKAEDWAEQPVDIQVEVGKYSALHWATKASNTVNAVLNPLQPYTEKLTSSTWSTTSRTVNLALSNVHYIVLGAVNVTTLSFINPAPSGQAQSLTLVIQQSGSGIRTITWPSSVKWSGGVAPTLGTLGAIYTLTFLTVNGGSLWLGHIGGGNYS